MEWARETKLNSDKDSEQSTHTQIWKESCYLNFRSIHIPNDWDESPLEQENPEAVIVDKIKLYLSDRQMEQPRRNINP